MKLNVQSRSVPYCPDPLRLFEAATAQCGRDLSFLLESADITTKQGERSLLGVRSCLKIECRGLDVQMTALQPLGHAIIAHLRRQLPTFVSGQGFSFPTVNQIASEEERLKAPSPTDVLRHTLAIPCDDRWVLGGVFAYDFLDVYEPLPEAASDRLNYPDFVFLVPDLFCEINHLKGTTTLKCLTETDQLDGGMLGDLEDTCRRARDAGPLDPSPALPQPVTVDVEDAEYQSWVRQIQAHIVAGDVFQAVASRTFELPCQDALAAYARLKTLNPSPYMFLFDDGAGVLFGASPETAVKVSGSPARVEIRPIAGTKPRGFDHDGELDLDLDTRLEAELRLDEKELAEHLMLIDLARNDIARVSEAGTRYVPKLLTVDRYAHVMHLVSYVEGQLRTDLDALHAYVASMNMGTLVGAPKIRAAQILRELERDKRGPYGGAVGYLSNRGDMDTAIAIRSAYVKNGTATIRAGAGIVHDSHPAEETLETRRKAQAVINAVGGRS